MLTLEVLGGDVRDDYIRLVHEAAVDDRDRRAAVAAAVGGHVVKGARP